MLKSITKRTVSMLLTFCLALSLLVGSANAAESLVAGPSKTSFVMNDVPITVPQAYNVNGNNYLQLRAIAVLLNGTAAQFNVSWDGTYAGIETGKQYSGTANPASLETTSNVKLSSTSFKLDDKVVTFEKAYLIDGDTNYLQLREVAEKLSGTKSQFNVYWNDELKQAVIETGTAYTGVNAATMPANTVKTDAVSYSTNDQDTAKKGDSGVFSYKSRGGTYDIYYIIDFDEGYVYYFCDGNGDTTCDRLKMDSGDLNDVLIITYHDGSDVWSYGLHFKWKNQPDHLIMQDNDGFEYDFYTTNLSDALSLRKSKTIVDY